jgi:hypothetical protein
LCHIRRLLSLVVEINQIYDLKLLSEAYFINQDLFLFFEKIQD